MPDVPLDVGGRRQVFIDGRFVQESQGIKLVVHPPRKTGELNIKPEHPWERRIGAYFSVLKIDDVYHLWYQALSEDQGVLALNVAYAKSKDGVHWVKPMRGLTEVFGTKQNNIVLGSGAGGMKEFVHEAMVFLDPKAPKEQRLRMVAQPVLPKTENRALHVFSSADGIHWKPTHENIMTSPRHPRHHLDSQNVFFWDDRIRKYVSYVRRNLRPDGLIGRTVARGESNDLSRFPEVEESPVVLGCDHLDPHHFDSDKKLDVSVLDYYTNATIKYPWAEDAYYMFPSAYYHYSKFLAEFKEQKPTNAGPVDVRFAASRDGIHWLRYDRRPFVRLGMKIEFDSKSNYMGSGLVPATNGREMYMYYVGSDILHGWGYKKNLPLFTSAGLAPEEEISAVSRLVLRRDGFISARAAYTGGMFMTPLLRFSGSELVLNVDTSAAGELQVEILDRLGSPIEDHRLQDCDLIHTTNEINRTVTWKGKSDISRFAGSPIQLRFAMRDVDLYAFQFR